MTDVWLPTDEELAELSPAELDLVLRILQAERDEERWEPHPKQAIAEELAGKAFETLFGGAAGPGKTEWGLEHTIAEMERHPGNVGGVFRRVGPSLTKTIVPRLKKKLVHGRAPRAAWNGNEQAFTFPNGSVLYAASLQYEDDVQKFQGVEFGVVFFEELTEFLETQYQFIVGSRVRAPAPGIRPHVIATTNPGGVGHRWVKRRFVRPRAEDAEGGREPEPFAVWRPRPTEEWPRPGTRVFVPARADDNPTLLVRDPGYWDRLRAAIADPGLRRAMATGDWDAIDAVEGALWRQSWLDEGRVWRTPETALRVVACDPSDGDEATDGDEFGIAVCAKGMDDEGYVEGSDGWRQSPRAMARAAVELYRDANADAIVVEKNHGGAWLREVFRSVDRHANVLVVWASDGKRTRAAPVAALFEPDPRVRPRAAGRFRAHLVGEHPELEEELTTFTGAKGEPSPNRLDAVVWGMSYLMLGVHVVGAPATYDDDRLEGRR